MAKTKSDRDKFSIQSINRAFTIIQEVSKANDRGISLSELAESIALPVSTVYRIMQNLMTWQYVAENQGGNYVLGFALLNLGNIVKKNIVLNKHAVKHMEELNQKTKETVYLAVLDQQHGDIIYVEKKDSLRNIQLAAGVGSRNYIHSTANGKCLVSSLSNEKILELLSLHGLPRLTVRTITDPAEFLAEVDKVRKHGYALDDLENEVGIKCVAAPIYDYSHKVVAAMSISGVESTMDEDAINQTHIPLVKEYAMLISKSLGYIANDAESYLL